MSEEYTVKSYGTGFAVMWDDAEFGPIATIERLNEQAAELSQLRSELAEANSKNYSLRKAVSELTEELLIYEKECVQLESKLTAS